MGKRKREHKQAVIAGTEKPFGTPPDEPKKGEQPQLSAPESITDRVRRLKEQQGG